jgi:hypothetical protein
VAQLGTCFVKPGRSTIQNGPDWYYTLALSSDHTSKQVDNADKVRLA